MASMMKASTQKLPPLAERFPTPWVCRHYADRSEILARDPFGTEWLVIAETQNHGRISAASTADTIAHLANTHEKTQNLLADALMLLEE